MNSPKKVAGGRLVLSGKIQVPVFPTETSTFNWSLSSFLYKNNSSRPIRLIEPTISEFYSPESRVFLSSISLITEIILD